MRGASEAQIERALRIVAYIEHDHWQGKGPENCGKEECLTCGFLLCPYQSETHLWHDGCALCLEAQQKGEEPRPDWVPGAPAREPVDVFNQTILCLGDPITIRETELVGPLGRIDTKTNTIDIDPRQHIGGKHIVLIHELLHLVDEQLIRTGIRFRRVDHSWISSMAGNLLALLIAAGLYRGCTLEELAAGWREPDELELRSELHQ